MRTPFWVVMTVLACGISAGAQDEAPPLAAGTAAPAITTKTINGGRSISLHGLRGKVVLVDYWATWCPPCRAATPGLVLLHKQFAKKGLVVLGMDVDEANTVSQVKPFLKQYGITYPVAVRSASNVASAQAYHVTGIPAQYVIDKKGIVRWSQSG